MKRPASLILLAILVLVAIALWARSCNRKDPYDPFKRDLPVRVVLLCGECDKEVTYTPDELQEIFRSERYLADDVSGGGLLPCPFCEKMAVQQVIKPRKKP